jgi:hypothetical protein
VRVTRGKVVGNTVVIEATDLPEGTEVSVLLDVEGWDLDPASWAELEAARRSIDEGRGVPAGVVLQKLSDRRRK